GRLECLQAAALVLLQEHQVQHLDQTTVDVILDDRRDLAGQFCSGKLDYDPVNRAEFIDARSHNNSFPLCSGCPSDSLSSDATARRIVLASLIRTPVIGPVFLQASPDQADRVITHLV